jgi:hypothetical protein
MRLRPDRIDAMAVRITAAMRAVPRITVNDPDKLQRIIRRIILEDMQREVELEKEAVEILRRHQQQITMQGMSYNTLLDKTKRELARQKKIVL